MPSPRVGDGTDPALDPLYDEAIRDTIVQFEATGSPVITDGEQRKYHNFWTYSVEGSAEHGARRLHDSVRRRPRPADAAPHRGTVPLPALRGSLSRTGAAPCHVPVKQAVISPSALSLMYPEEGLPDYSREAFIEDLVREHVTEVRRCLAEGAHSVQIDFTEARLAHQDRPDRRAAGELHRSQQPRARRGFTPPSASASACTPVPAATATPRTAPTWTTRSCCRACSSSTSTNFYVALAGERDRDSACSSSSAST